MTQQDTLHDAAPALLAAASANAALLHIQTALAVTGDFASIYFDGERWDLLTSILADYIRAEIKRGQS